MPSLRRPSNRALCAVSAGLLACAAIAWLLSRADARAASVGQLQQQISSHQNRISSLSGAVSAASNRLGQLGLSIAGLERQIGRIQADLNAQRAALLQLR